MIQKVKRFLWRRATPVKLIVHIGLHKTGSTYLQHVLNDNSDALRDRGIYYPKRLGYPAHHDVAWELLRGEPGLLRHSIDEARRAGCKQLIISSEDLEGILHDERPLQAIRRAMSEACAKEIEFHVVLREPGSAFSSLYRELAKHTYVDAVSLYFSIMERGWIHMVQSGEGTPYWYYSFDHYRDIKRLSERSGCDLFVHDFADCDPFPGWRIIEKHLVAINDLPDDAARNTRDPDSETVSKFDTWLKKIGVNRSISLAQVDEFSQSIADKFKQSHYAALRFNDCKN